MLREGWPGRNGDRLMDYFFKEPLESAIFSSECLAPGPEGNVISRKGKVVDRDKFEKLKDEYYQLRGWDVPTGFPTIARLEQLGLRDIAKVLKENHLAV
jgi:aldehyde:ferredoxin oxidoreductase